jgi:deoxycytidine triphosphate deaminase
MSIGLARVWTALLSWANYLLFGPELPFAMPKARPTDARSLNVATTRADFEERADWWEFEDPFDDLDPALLTAEQINNYARVTGLVRPFDEKLLKGATYEIGVSGNVYFWNEKKKKKIVPVESVGETGFVLEANSITFVETDVEFRLPQYIAMRFNLHIKLVHRGLLLGTGPIVDPGFRGRLLIPLHNLTSQALTIKPGEKIVWIEFTKTAFGQSSAREGYQKELPDFRVFPKNKRWLEPEFYFQKANSGNPIMSSISGFISKTNKQLARNTKWVNTLGVTGFISIALTVFGGLYASWTVLNNAWTAVNADIAQRKDVEARLQTLERCLKTAKVSNMPPAPDC